MTDPLQLMLTSEEAHYLAAAAGLETVPGLGPPPVDADREDSRWLLVGTARRSLEGRGLVALGPDGPRAAPPLDKAFETIREAHTTAVVRMNDGSTVLYLVYF